MQQVLCQRKYDLLCAPPVCTPLVLFSHIFRLTNVNGWFYSGMGERCGFFLRSVKECCFLRKQEEAVERQKVYLTSPLPNQGYRAGWCSVCARTCFPAPVLALAFIVLFLSCELLSRLRGASSLSGKMREDTMCVMGTAVCKNSAWGVISDINLGITLP